ncbi:MAG: RluA family pseudouridine synthase [Treponema sp.]|jgi:23S rRNA pseudouridine955/2504/2580 synthase|nr:RluA family pseudouridine synthase [Treponema sp.]
MNKPFRGPRLKRVDVLFENELCLVLNKPAGLPVQGGRGVGVSLDGLLAAAYSPRPLLVHRLDRDTSGVILAAKSREAAALFAGLFAEKSRGAVGAGIRKWYLALCAGSPGGPSGAEGLIDRELAVRGRAKPSGTAYRKRGDGEGFSLMELEPGTGRMHQIRRHLALAGAPILGDDKYGDFPLNKRLRKTLGIKRLLLHALRLSIPSELAGFPLDVTAPLPDYFTAALKQFSIQDNH